MLEPYTWEGRNNDVKGYSKSSLRLFFMINLKLLIEQQTSTKLLKSEFGWVSLNRRLAGGVQSNKSRSMQREMPKPRKSFLGHRKSLMTSQIP